MFNGGSELSPPPPIKTPPGGHQIPGRAYVRIVEQPASKALRFRYECEGRSAGSIPGASSTLENKTFPSIQVVGFQGRAVVVVSCVTKDDPYKPHPHNLVGREGCKRGVCTLEIPQETMSIQFCNLGIQCVKKKDIESALKVREEIRVDPYRTGFAHRNQPTSIDLNAVRLCFQVFLEGDSRGKFTVPLLPVVSEPIFDKKAMSDLVIVKMSDYETTVDGGRKDIILLCEKVAKEDIQVRFYEEKDGMLVWEGFGDFQPSQVHKQTAIWFRPPRYHTLDIADTVRVNVQLRRPSDGTVSEPQLFDYHSMDGGLKRKRTKFDGSPLLPGQEIGIGSEPYGVVKLEPNDNYQYSTSPHHMYGGIVEVQEPRVAAPTPSPEVPYHVETHENLPHTLPVSNGSWNIPFRQRPSNLPETVNNTNNIENVNPVIDTPIAMDSGKLRSLFDLDSQQMELKQINLNSGELDAFDINNLSETLNANLSLSDINPKDQNMTDSLTRLANNTIERMCREDNNNFK